MTAYPPPPYSAPSAPPARPALDPLDLATLGAVVLAFILSFFAYYNFSPTPAAQRDCTPGNLQQAPQWAKDFCNGGLTADAWHGFFGWFGVLLAILGALALAAALFAPSLRLPVSARLLALGGIALGLIFTLVAIGVVPSYAPQGMQVTDQSVYDQNVERGHDWAFWVVLILLLIALVLAVMRFQRVGGMAGLAAASHPRAPAPPPPPGYGAPPAPGYGTPPPPAWAPPPPPPGLGPPPQP